MNDIIIVQHWTSCNFYCKQVLFSDVGGMAEPQHPLVPHLRRMILINQKGSLQFLVYIIRLLKSSTSPTITTDNIQLWINLQRSNTTIPPKTLHHFSHEHSTYSLAFLTYPLE